MRRRVFLPHAALLLLALGTYVFSPEDVVWHFVQASPHARLLEHLAFGAAAVLLGTALLLQTRRSRGSRPRAAQLLQAVGIGSLLPLPGFLLLVLGTLLLAWRQRTGGSAPEDVRGTDSLLPHLGLLCAFASMVVFSVVLVDRVADVLFAITGAVSLLAALRDGRHAAPSTKGRA